MSGFRGHVRIASSNTTPPQGVDAQRLELRQSRFRTESPQVKGGGTWEPQDIKQCVTGGTRLTRF